MMMANSTRRAAPDFAAATMTTISANSTDNAIHAALPTPAEPAAASTSLPGVAKYHLIPMIANTRAATSGIVTEMHQPNASRQGLPASWHEAFKLWVILSYQDL